MSIKTLPERLTVLEDEVAVMDSRVDSRTRRLWAEIEGLKIQIQDLRERLKEAACQN
jgi:hypothetical protein